MKKIIIAIVALTLSIGSFAREGEFESFGNHNTEGLARVTADSSGQSFLELEDFLTDRGPDVRVYLSKSKSPTEIIDLGLIKSFSGDQEYVIPSGVELDEYTHVLIWCEDFSVLFGSAEI